MIYINALGMLNALGSSIEEIKQHLVADLAPGMKQREGWLQPDQSCVLGGVDTPLADLPEQVLAHNSRNNRLLFAAVQQISVEINTMISTYGVDRIGVILGTSTSGLSEADRFVSASYQEKASTTDFHYCQQELGDPSQFLSSYLGITGPAYTISTACSSSARAILSGKRLIDAGIIDAAIVGGVDTLSRMPINGFNSLEALSPDLCQPFAENRTGITIGEAACLMVISKQPAKIALLGGGESSDAYHMSAPQPEGIGAERAIRMALDNAGLDPSDIGYINLHGTGTPLNDQMESAVIHRIFGDQVPCSSTKHLTGHTLGAAGAGEAGLCWLLLNDNLLLPAQHFDQQPKDVSLACCGLLSTSIPLVKKIILSNSFAFGGNNCVLILGEIDHAL